MTIQAARRSLGTKQEIEAFMLDKDVIFSERDTTEKRVQSYTDSATRELRLVVRVVEGSEELAKQALSEYLGDIKHTLVVTDCAAFKNMRFVRAGLCEPVDESILITLA